MMVLVRVMVALVYGLTAVNVPDHGFLGFWGVVMYNCIKKSLDLKGKRKIDNVKNGCQLSEFTTKMCN